MRVGLRVRGRVWGLLLLGAMGVEGVAQEAGGRAPVATVGAELRELASRAGVVLVGQVVKIEPKAGVVEITFAVEQPVVGVVGGTYVMREWAGRWTGGQQPFRVGQRAMFFLHAPSAAGLSSAVDGMMGAVPVVPMGANGQALLDVRWLATRVKREMGAALTAGVGGVALGDGVGVAKSWRAEAMEEPKVVSLPEGVVGGARGSAQAQAGGVGGERVRVKEGADADR